MVDEYFKLENGVKIYYSKFQKIGTEFEMVKHLISTKKISSSKAHKEVNKIKELKEGK